MALTLEFVWKLRLRLRAEGDKLWAEGDKLRAEGDKLWAEGVIEVHGNVLIEWTGTSCIVEGVEYKETT